MQLALTMAGQTEVPPDSGIWVPGEGIRRVLMAVDLDTPELLLARLQGYDAAIAHHPPKPGGLPPAMYQRHVDLMTAAGVPAAEAEAAVADRLAALHRAHHAANSGHSPAVARLLGLPYLNIHNPLDEVGRRRLQAVADEGDRPDRTLAELLAALRRLPELDRAQGGPEVAVGDPAAPAGRVVVVHAAGTNGGYEVASAYYRAGVGTVVYIHADAASVARLRREGRGQLVVSGHIGSDLVGIHPFADALRTAGLTVDVLEDLA